MRRDELKAYLENPDIDNKFHFRQVIDAALNLGLIQPGGPFFDKFFVSFIGVQKWAKGTGCPHPVIRKDVYKYLKEELCQIRP